MKELLREMLTGYRLSKEEAYGVLKEVASGEASDAELASFLTILAMRGACAAELKGMRAAMLELCLEVDLSQYAALDIVGSGGSGKDTFNISTLAAMVIAGAGQCVIKHGSYGFSSKCGSSNVLEALGVPLVQGEVGLRELVESAGVCFIHAPYFHPAMKRVVPVRRSLGFRTVFNLLGPLCNPAQPPFQLLGVSSPELLSLYQEVLEESDADYMVIHSEDGYDECSLTSTCRILSRRGEKTITPEQFGFESVQAEELSSGDSVEDAARIFEAILKGEGTISQNNVVIANAGLGLQCAKPDLSLEECLERARESLQSGSALAVLNTLRSMEVPDEYSQ